MLARRPAAQKESKLGTKRLAKGQADTVLQGAWRIGARARARTRRVLCCGGLTRAHTRVAQLQTKQTGARAHPGNVLGDVTNRQSTNDANDTKKQMAAKNKVATSPPPFSVVAAPPTPPGAEILALPGSRSNSPEQQQAAAALPSVTAETLESSFLAPEPPARRGAKAAKPRMQQEATKRATPPRVAQMPELAQALSPLADAAAVRPPSASKSGGQTGWDKGWQDIERFATSLTQNIGALGSAFLDSPGGAPAPAPAAPAAEAAVQSHAALSAAMTSAAATKHSSTDAEWDEFGLVEQSLDAINTVGRVALGVASAIDGAIEGSIEVVKKKMSPLKKLGARISPKGKGARPAARTATSGAAAPTAVSASADGWDNGDWGAFTPVTRSKGGAQAKATPASVDILQKRVKQMERDLDRQKARCEELQKAQMDAQNQAAAVMTAAAVPASPDPLQEQLRLQMEALLREKARLAHENERLVRENEGLHELLQYAAAAPEPDCEPTEEATTPEATIRSVSMIPEDPEEEDVAQEGDDVEDADA